MKKLNYRPTIQENQIEIIWKIILNNSKRERERESSEFAERFNKERIVFDYSKCKKIKIGELFHVKRGKRIVKNVDYFENQDDKNIFPVITAKTTDNGIDGYYHRYNCDGQCLVSCGDASGMFTTYQKNKV